MLKIEPDPDSCLHPALNFLSALNTSVFPIANIAISVEEGCGYVLKNGLIVQIMPFLMKRAVGMYLKMDSLFK